jgi:uncharacterized protein (DUF849 family)
MYKIISIYLENKTQKAKRLGKHRQTLNAWQKKPDSADLNLIKQDIIALLRLIEEYEARHGS